MTTSNRTRSIRRMRTISFSLGAAIGSALGILLGSMITFWLGEWTVRIIQRGLRRMGGADDHPNFEALAQ